MQKNFMGHHRFPNFDEIQIIFFLKKCADLFRGTQYYRVAEKIVPRNSKLEKLLKYKKIWKKYIDAAESWE